MTAVEAVDVARSEVRDGKRIDPPGRNARGLCRRDIRGRVVAEGLSIAFLRRRRDHVYFLNIRRCDAALGGCFVSRRNLRKDILAARNHLNYRALESPSACMKKLRHSKCSRRRKRTLGWKL